ncbi:uncharacterized protein LOC143241650 [Tachypleus tridentatus]|uniref:uncharacterized protein LOC143241650 n=1 Tax=Tachypleus tridentatus TaxID=6853 RepID=UPI003FD09B55
MSERNIEDELSDVKTQKPSEISTSMPKKPTPSPKKSSGENGVGSPTKSSPKIPPIKAPVGQAPPPNVKSVTSKIGSLQNVKHKPGGGERKIISKKLDWSAESKVGSLEKTSYKPGGSAKKIQTQKLDWKAQSKVGSKENIKYSPGGGKVKIEHHKPEWKATSKIGSLNNIQHKPGGGDVKVKSEKLTFREKATPRVVSDKESSRGSETQDSITSMSPPPSETPVEFAVDESTKLSEKTPVSQLSPEPPLHSTAPDAKENQMFFHLLLSMNLLHQLR